MDASESNESLIAQLAEIDALLALSDDLELRTLRDELAGRLGLVGENGILATQVDGLERTTIGSEVEEAAEEEAPLEPGSSCLVAHGPVELPLQRPRACLVLLPAFIVDIIQSSNEALVHILCPLDDEPAERSIPINELFPSSPGSSQRGDIVAARSSNNQWKLARVIESRHTGTELFVESLESHRSRPRSWTVGHDDVVPVTVVPLNDDDGQSDIDGNALDHEFDVESRAARSHSSDSSDSSTAPPLPTLTGPSDFGEWERHTRGIASKLMAKMGFIQGQGLGRRKQGTEEPVEAVRSVPGRGLGYEKGKPKVRTERKEKGKNQGKNPDAARPPDMFGFLNRAISQPGRPNQRTASPQLSRPSSASPKPSSASPKPSKPSNSTPESLAISDRRIALLPQLARAKQRLVANTRDPTLSRHYAEEIKQLEGELKILDARENVLSDKERARKIKDKAIRF